MTTPERSRLMSRIRGKNTGPELSVRRVAHSWGFRFRLHRRELPGCPDLVFPRLRKAILVHGCFWHHHDDPACRNAVLPKTRAEWWRAKLLANVERDARNLRDLQSLGWDVLVLWECEIPIAPLHAKACVVSGRSAACPRARPKSVWARAPVFG